MATIEITAVVDVPEDANYEQTLEWVKFELGAIAMMRGGKDNPLSVHDLEASSVSIREI